MGNARPMMAPHPAGGGLMSLLDVNPRYFALHQGHVNSVAPDAVSLQSNYCHAIAWSVNYK